MSFQNLLFKHYNRSIQLWLMHCLVLRSQSAALSYVLAGWAIIGSTDTNTEGYGPSKARDYEITDRIPHSKETRIFRRELFFQLLFSVRTIEVYHFPGCHVLLYIGLLRWGFLGDLAESIRKHYLYPNYWLGTPGTLLYGHTYWGNTVLYRARMLTRCVRLDRKFPRGRAMWHKYTCMWRTLRRLTLV